MSFRRQHTVRWARQLYGLWQRQVLDDLDNLAGAFGSNTRYGAVGNSTILVCAVGVDDGAAHIDKCIHRVTQQTFCVAIWFGNITAQRGPHVTTLLSLLEAYSIQDAAGRVETLGGEVQLWTCHGVDHRLIYSQLNLFGCRLEVGRQVKVVTDSQLTY